MTVTMMMMMTLMIAIIMMIMMFFTFSRTCPWSAFGLGREATFKTYTLYHDCDDYAGYNDGDVYDDDIGNKDDDDKEENKLNVATSVPPAPSQTTPRIIVSL